ncbi:sensor histidine kinase [Thalassospira profundimaris]|jgi:signal transduction histidine kinase|uniref:sensor histidine kinase n=1 Tax=Thalassospira profundimaris TaxID=502049 RepID=UPI0002871523|nr:HAMP domain-containing sensor histidine kinase [Thalassospira profundimaris]EKF10477.1 sensor signal transduction histidine kinase [Thalassospira profundimaris WP0211]
MVDAQQNSPSVTDHTLPLVEGRKSRWHQDGYFWRVTSILAVCGMLVFFGLMTFWHTLEASREDEQTVRRLVVDVTHRAADLQQWYETAIQTVNLSILHPAVQEFETQPEATIRYFRSLAREVQRFSQLRIVLPSGMEAVRVDARGNEVIVTPEDELQDKSDRYYMEAARSLSPGQVYVSRLDLNVENGEIEVPWRPTTRLVAPISGIDESVVGYLIVNLDMGAPLVPYETALNGVTRTELVNPDGYWLAGAEDGRNWGFMLQHNASVAQVDPQLWQRIKSVQAQGGFEYAGRIYEVETLPIERMLSSFTSGSMRSESARYHIVASSPAYQVWAGNKALEVIFVCLVLVLIWAFSGGIGYLMLRRRQTAELQALLTKDLLVQGRMASLGRIVAGVSHEMRTPLGNALTVTTTMADDLQDLQQSLITAGDFDEERTEMINALIDGNRIVQKNIGRTKELLKHFNQTATDQTVHIHRSFDLSKVISDLVATLRNQFKKTGIKLTAVLPPSAHLDSYSDAIDQVILSLIMNAHQHAFVGREKGEISIRLSERDADNFLLEIADNGIGIAPENHDKIFEPFWSVDGTTGGSGLGLAIILNVVQNTLGGKIKISSVPGSGTVFQIVLPKTAPIRDSAQASPFSVKDEAPISPAGLEMTRSG